MFLQGPPTLLQDPKTLQKRGLSNAKLHFVGVSGNSNYDGILCCVIWHFSSLKVWTEGPTATKDSETLGFSHLGTPNLQLVRFLCTIGCSFPALGSFDEIECSCRVPQHCCKIPKPYNKEASAMPNYILWVYAGNSNYDGIL